MEVSFESKRAITVDCKGMKGGLAILWFDPLDISIKSS